MRKIKFRAWDKENKHMTYNIQEMYDGYCDETDNSLYEYMSCFTSFLYDENFIIMQYTGLKDKNGKEIYEGDIIDINQTVNGCNLFEIVWDKTRWNAKYAIEMVTPRLYEYNFNELLDVDAEEKEIEVVGNIYEGE